MIKNLSYVSLAYIYVNLIGYLFHFYVSRELSPSGYGEFMVLYSFMLTVGYLSSVLSVVSVKTFVEYDDFKEDTLRFLRILALLIGVILYILSFILSPFLRTFLRISHVYYIWIVSFAWIFMFIVAIERGFLQANGKFGLFALSSSLELTIRFLSAVFLLYLGFYVGGAISSSIVGLISVLIFLLIINKNLLGKLKVIPLQNLFLIAAYTSPTGFFVYLDDIFIKRTFPAHIAGYYASFSILGKALIWFCLSLFSVFFPKMVELKNDKSKLSDIFLKLIMVTSVIYISVLISVHLFGRYFYLLLFGSKYLTAFKYLHYYIIATFPLTMDMLIIGLLTSLGKLWKIIYIHLIFYTMGFIFLSLSCIENYMLYIVIINLFFLLVYFYFLFKHRLLKFEFNAKLTKKF